MTKRETVEKLVSDAGFDREDAQFAVQWAEDHGTYHSRSASVYSDWGMGVFSFSVKLPIRS